MSHSLLQADFWSAFNEYAASASFLKEPLLEPSHVSLVSSIESTNTALMQEFSASTKDFIFEARPAQKASLTPEGVRLHKRLIASTMQTAGRGRSGRIFFSKAQKGLYFSLSYIPLEQNISPAQYTVSAAVGICRAIQALYGVSAHIKWVNDILLNDKKVCGILTEGFTRPGKNRIEALIIGIGINVFFAPQALSEQDARLLKNASGIENEIEKLQNQVFPTPSAFLARVCFEILKILSQKENVIDEYRAYSCLIGKRVHVTPLALGTTQDGYEALVRGITDNALLKVELENGSIQMLSSGEVSLHSA